MKQNIRNIGKTLKGMLVLALVLGLCVLAYKFVGLVPAKFLQNNWKGICVGIVFTIAAQLIGGIFKEKNKTQKK